MKKEDAVNQLAERVIVSEKLIVALDVDNEERAIELVETLERSFVSFFKIGLELSLVGGIDFIASIAKYNRVFVDLKLPNDIPETIERVVRVLTNAGVAFISLSDNASDETIRAAIRGRGDKKFPKILFVSRLSSDESSIVYGVAAKEAGIDGFIASGRDIYNLREYFPDALIVSPGIRLEGASHDDHKLVCTPSEAISMGANYIVVGRPISRSDEPRLAVLDIIKEMKEGKTNV